MRYLLSFILLFFLSTGACFAEKAREKIKTGLFRKVTPEMPSTEIEVMIEDIINGL